MRMLYLFSCKDLGLIDSKSEEFFDIVVSTCQESKLLPVPKSVWIGMTPDEEFFASFNYDDSGDAEKTDAQSWVVFGALCAETEYQVFGT